MKKILLLAIIILVFAQVTLGQIPSYVPSNGLVGWWPFHGNANDQSGTANTGTVTGATLVMDRKNNANQAYSFSPSTTSKIELKSTPTTISNTFTISIWVKPNRTINLISESNACPGTTTVPMANSNQNWAYTPTSAKIGVGISIGTNAVLVAEHAANLLICRMGYTTTINAFVHVIVTYANDSTKLYINGKLVRSRPTLCTTVHNIIEPHQLGMALYSPNFSGIIDDFGIWNRALTQKEVESLYNECDLISKEPSNQSSNINGQSQFNVILNDTTAAYQWQSNPSNVGWVNLLSNSVYSGVATKMLKVSNVQVNNHKQLFRVIATKNTCKDTSVVAMLTVNDTCITSTTDTLYIKVNTSSVNNPIYNTLKVYPNPSSTHVIIDNGNYNTMGAYTAKIVNTAGQQVFQSFINQQQFTIDAKTLGGAGVYTLYITDALNKVVGVKKIVLQ